MKKILKYTIIFLSGFALAVFVFGGKVPRLEWEDNYNQLKEDWSENCLFFNTNIKVQKNGYSYRPHELFCID